MESKMPINFFQLEELSRKVGLSLEHTELELFHDIFLYSLFKFFICKIDGSEKDCGTASNVMYPELHVQARAVFASDRRAGSPQSCLSFPCARIFFTLFLIFSGYRSKYCHNFCVSSPVAISCNSSSVNFNLK